MRGVGRTLGDLLTAGLTGPDGPASAARVLGASATGPGRFQMTVQLEPPELGQVQLRIQMQQQVVSLHIDVENNTVARLIQSRMSELHDALAAQGVRVDRTDVVVRSPASGDAGFNQQPGDQGGDPGRAANDAASGWTAGGFHGGPPERGAGEGGWDGGAADEPWTADPSGKSEEPAPAANARRGEASLDVMA